MPKRINDKWVFTDQEIEEKIERGKALWSKNPMTMNKETDAGELLPCPFCNAKAELIAEIDEPLEKPRFWHISCSKGCVSTWTTGVKAKSIERWNTRADAALRLQLTKARDALGHYADEGKWRTSTDTGTFEDWYCGGANGFDIAQAALDEIGTEDVDAN